MDTVGLEDSIHRSKTTVTQIVWDLQPWRQGIHRRALPTPRVAHLGRQAVSIQGGGRREMGGADPRKRLSGRNARPASAEALEVVLDNNSLKLGFRPGVMRTRDFSCSLSRMCSRGVTNCLECHLSPHSDDSLAQTRQTYFFAHHRWYLELSGCRSGRSGDEVDTSTAPHSKKD